MNDQNRETLSQNRRKEIMAPYIEQRDTIYDLSDEAKEQYELCQEIINGITSTAAQLDLSIESLNYANSDCDRFQSQLSSDVISQEDINNLKEIFLTLRGKSEEKISEIGTLKSKMESLFNEVQKKEKLWWERHAKLLPEVQTAYDNWNHMNEHVYACIYEDEIVHLPLLDNYEELKEYNLDEIRKAVSI